MLRAVATPTPATVGTWEVLAASAVAVSHTGDTVETTLATITIPGGAMGANGVLRVTPTWSATNNGNAKTLRVRMNGIGGTAYLATGITTHQTLREQAEIHNRDSESSQKGFATNTGGWGVGNGPMVTSAIDTSANVDLVLTAKLADAGDTATLESYLVELFYKA